MCKCESCMNMSKAQFYYPKVNNIRYLNNLIKIE